MGGRKHQTAALKQAMMAGDKEFIALYAPPAIDLPEAYYLYVNAYLTLDHEREYTAYIPWSVKCLYCDRYGLTDEQEDWLMELLTRVDHVVIAARIKEVNKSGKDAS